MGKKHGSIFIRVEEQVKSQIEAAARRKGLTLTTFILDAAEKAADRVLAKPLPRQHSGVPSFFRCCCQEATKGGPGYSNAAYQLCVNLASQQPHGVESDEWEKEVEDLSQLAETNDKEAIWSWFQERFPKAMKLVPGRRAHQFVAGVVSAGEDGRIVV